MSSLQQRLTARIDASTLKAIVPPVSNKLAQQRSIIEQFGDMLPPLLDRFEVDTPLRIAHLLAQTAHESDLFVTTEEYASGAAYEARTDLGNTQPGDGKRYKGRGPIQLTGRANYRLFTAWLRKINPDCPDFEANPDLVELFPWAGWAVFYFWSEKKLNAYADRDDLVGETRVINGGRNGLDHRAELLAKAKTVIAGLQGDGMSGRQVFPVINRGMSGKAVEDLQRALAAAGFYLQAIDGQFGAATEGALKVFQRERGLTVDGIAGRETSAALAPYLKG
ncbi:peptidoglycan-binding protein [Rhizobium chutanense]|uniref:Peptidoglycan-binding protein n=1 Tax=Rhizobium chutanense TaxID=2035448 RepID=A0A2A6JI97_9HYPH|nr:peptidoglycan-binding protein [Rhizobium chutanense]PDT05722.1 peptidoglycan-binding protein [Rhizobium chutanense]